METQENAIWSPFWALCGYFREIRIFWENPPLSFFFLLDCDDCVKFTKKSRCWKNWLKTFVWTNGCMLDRHEFVRTSNALGRKIHCAIQISISVKRIIRLRNLISDLRLLAWKLIKLLKSFFKPPLNFSLNIASPLSVMTNNSSVIF